MSDHNSVIPTSFLLEKKHFEIQFIIISYLNIIAYTFNTRMFYVSILDKFNFDVDNNELEIKFSNKLLYVWRFPYMNIVKFGNHIIVGKHIVII